MGELWSALCARAETRKEQAGSVALLLFGAAALAAVCYGCCVFTLGFGEALADSPVRSTGPRGGSVGVPLLLGAGAALCSGILALLLAVAGVVGAVQYVFWGATKPRPKRDVPR